MNTSMDYNSRLCFNPLTAAYTVSYLCYWSFVVKLRGKVEIGGNTEWIMKNAIFFLSLSNLMCV